MFMTRSTVLVLQYDLPNGLLASQNCTNLFGYTKYLNLNLVSLLIPINLAYSNDVWSLITKETSLPDIRLENIGWKNLSIRLNETTHGILNLGWSGRWWRSWRAPPTSDNARSKETERIIHSSWSNRSSLLILHWLRQSKYLYSTVITDYLPFVN